MNEKLKKIAEAREERKKNFSPAYEMEEDWSVYGPNCPVHVGVRKLLVGDMEKTKLGYKKSDLVWKCPIDGEVFVAEGSVGEQTDGFAAFNNTLRNNESITDDGFNAAKKLAKEMGYIDNGPESD